MGAKLRPITCVSLRISTQSSSPRILRVDSRPDFSLIPSRGSFRQRIFRSKHRTSVVVARRSDPHSCKEIALKKLVGHRHIQHTLSPALRKTWWGLSGRVAAKPSGSCLPVVHYLVKRMGIEDAPNTATRSRPEYEESNAVKKTKPVLSRPNGV